MNAVSPYLAESEPIVIPKRQIFVKPIFGHLFEIRQNPFFFGEIFDPFFCAEFRPLNPTR